MSGHSKWAQIKRQKGATDAKRGQAFTKLANAITVAVRESGGISDPAQNFKLRLLVEKARAVNMPKENIERAIQRASGKQAGEGVAEITYEGFGPGKVALMVDAVTDNKQRTTSEVKNILDKNGAVLATPGAVSYQFVQKGLITVKKNGQNADDIFLLAADAGAEDIEEVGDEILVYTKPDQLSKVKEGLTKSLNIVDAELTRKPMVTVSITNKEIASKILTLMERLESLDDVQKVYANFDITDEIISSQTE
ncbi:MAG: YebC/PmpR family DNA-binding transcriptional regulator [Candidatus Levybacteria bacterium]|nr:YebC/PmpR family DNA-binding transcriptional regulator [Candidatus Levybacteria bacterium]